MVISDDGIETTAPGELLQRARAGDAPAFCRLTEPLQSRLLRQAAAMTGDVNAAEDLVSETLVEAWKSLARYDGSCRFSTWLCAILLHRRQKWARRARSRPLSLAWLPAENIFFTQSAGMEPTTAASPARTTTGFGTIHPGKILTSPAACGRSRGCWPPGAIPTPASGAARRPAPPGGPAGAFF